MSFFCCLAFDAVSAYDMFEGATQREEYGGFMLIIADEQFEKLRGKAYKDMIEVAIKLSDAVMLVYADSDDHPMSDGERDMRCLLSPYLLYSRNNGEVTPEQPYFEWPGTRIGYRDPTDPAELFYSGDSRIYVDTYAVSDFVKDVLLSADSFEDWMHHKGRPTDMCFFKDGACWFETTVHEYCMGIDYFEDEFFEILHNGEIQYEYYTTSQDMDNQFREPYMLD